MRALHARFLPLVLAVATTGLVVVPTSVSAQSQLDTSEATEFIGTWSIRVDNPQTGGQESLGVRITDVMGKVAASLLLPQFPAANISNITRSGPGLVLRADLDFDGIPVPMSVTLRPEGDGYVAVMDFADGQFMATAPATKDG